MLELGQLALLQRTLEEGSFMDGLGWGSGLILALLGGPLFAVFLRRFGALGGLGRNGAGSPLGSWGAREIFELCAAALAFLLFMSYLVSDLEELGAADGLVFNTIWMLLLCGIAYGLARQADGVLAAPALGLRQPPGEDSEPRASAGATWAWSMGLGLGSYLLYLPFLLGIYLIWPLLGSWVGVQVDDQVVLTEILALEGKQLFIALAIAGVIGPFLEEWIFRGFLQPVLVRSLGALGGIAATSVLFAMMHGGSVFLPIFAFSLLLGWLQLRTRCLGASWAAHAFHNSLILSLYLS